MLVLINVKTGLYLGLWADVVADLRIEIAPRDIFLIVTIVCTFPTVWGIGPAPKGGGRGGAMSVYGG